MKSAVGDQPLETDDEGGVSAARPLSQRVRPETMRGAATDSSFMDSTDEQVEERTKQRRASERRSSLTQIEELKVRRASERRSSVRDGQGRGLW